MSHEHSDMKLWGLSANAMRCPCSQGMGDLILGLLPVQQAAAKLALMG